MALWQQLLAHKSYRKISKMANNEEVYGLNLSNKNIPTHHFPGCLSEKMHRLSFPIGRTRANQTELIHAEVFGPIYISTPSGARYFTLFIDDFSGWHHVYFLIHKAWRFSKTTKAFYIPFVQRIKVNSSVRRSNRGYQTEVSALNHWHPTHQSRMSQLNGFWSRSQPSICQEFLPWTVGRDHRICRVHSESSDQQQPQQHLTNFGMVKNKTSLTCGFLAQSLMSISQR